MGINKKATLLEWRNGDLIMDPDQLAKTTQSLADMASTTLDFTKSASNTTLGKNIGTALNGLFLTCFGTSVANGLVEQSKVDALQNSLQVRIENIPQENRTIENKMLILKSLEELRYQLDYEDVRDMFISLISNSFNKDYSSDISPLLVQILGNMSSKTAIFLKEWQSIPTTAAPYTNITINNPDGSVKITHPSVIVYSINKDYDDSMNLVDVFEIVEIPQEVSELEYFGLVKIHETRSLVGMDDMYTAISQKYKANIYNFTPFGKAESPKEYDENIQFRPGMIELTEIGKIFCNIVFSLRH
jgi:hypothetical protein